MSNLILVREAQNFKAKIFHSLNCGDVSIEELKEIIYKILKNYDVAKFNHIKKLLWCYKTSNLDVEIFDLVYNKIIKCNKIYDGIIEIDFHIILKKSEERKSYKLILTNFMRKTKYTHNMNMDFKLYNIYDEL